MKHFNLHLPSVSSIAQIPVSRLLSSPFTYWPLEHCGKLQLQAYDSTMLQSAPRSTLPAYGVLPVKRRTCRSTKLCRLQIVNARGARLATQSTVGHT